MASRHAPSELNDSSGPVQSPPTISLSDKLLGSVIPLPDQPCVVYSIFTPLPGGASRFEIMELARRKLLERNHTRSLLDSWLPCVLMKREPALYVYSIVTQRHSAKCISHMNGLIFDGLQVSETSSFLPKDIYPCSLSCSNQRNPCQICIESQSDPSSSTLVTSPNRTASSSPIRPASAVCLLPRRPLRHIFFRFLEALRDRIISDISEKNIHSRFIMRFKNGFMLGQVPRLSESHAASRHQLPRSLTYCHLDILFTSSNIIVHPILRPTHFLPFHTSLPILPGTPLTLVPFSVPAYFLSTYPGPTISITIQFEQYLSGLGVGDWKLPLSSKLSHNEKDINDDSSCTPYLVVWINVENKQGEEKGMSVIWPARLCLSFHPSSTSAHSRMPLSYLPQLPSQLQPSPKVSSSSTHAVELEQAVFSSSSARTPGSPSRRRACRPLINDSLRAFRSMAVSLSNDINRVATEVGGYVDAVAKEREKERERIRREREIASTAASPRTMGITGAPLPGPSHPVMTPGPTHGPARNEPTDGPSVSAPLVPTPPTQSQAPVAVVQQSPNQNVYPSPPQSNIPQTEPIDAMQTSPEVVLATLPDVQTPGPQTQLPAEEIPTASSTSLDPFTNLGTSNWPQQSYGDFLGMDIDFGMGDFDLGMDPIASSGGGGGGSGIYDRGMEQDDTFTDDDFSFFDRPSGAAPINASTPVNNTHINAKMTDTTDLSPLVFPSPLFTSDLRPGGPGPPSFTTAPSHLMSPWAPGPLGDAFTPAEISYTDTLASSPERTPWSRSVPSSPIVQLSHDQNRPENRGSSIFDPIPFTRNHRLSDGKYAVGKFALPSPPDEEDRTEVVPTLLSPPSRLSGWQYRYDAVTDPRIGVVRKLAGYKRNRFDHGGKKPVKRVWRSDPGDYSTKTGDDKSEVESEEEMEENDLPMDSRPSTPPPGYLPLGPTLLSTRFQHSQLLPLTTPLRPPGAAVAPANITSPTSANSVPTPVSPAAVIGAASEKSRSLEAAAQIVAREVVENSIWANAWRSNVLSASSHKHSGDIWQADVMAVKEYLEGVAGPDESVDIATLFVFHDPINDNDIERPLPSMESPMISVAKADAVIQILPTALRFWEKLGLGPRGGKKDVTAFLLFESEDAERLQQAERWLGNMSATYMGKRFGRHIAGNCSAAVKAGLVPLRFDAFRKNILSFIANLTNIEGHLVFYVATPASAMTLASPLLRQFLAGVKRTYRTCVGVPVFHFVPEYIVFGSFEEPAAYLSHLESLCFSLYDRILRPVHRMTARHLPESEEKVRVQGYIQDPAFTLARTIRSKVKFVWQAPARSLDVVDRHTLLHVGYQVTPCKKWILAACIDERGEGHNIGVWLTQSEAHESQVVSQVWSFALQFARRTNAEWRIALAKLGGMKETELNAWIVNLENTVSTCQELSMLHVSLLCVDPDVPWTFTMPHDMKRSINPRRTSLRDKSGLVIVDSSASTYALFSKTRIPLSSAASSFRDLSSELHFVPEADDAADREEPSILPLSTSTLVRVPNEPGFLSVSMLQVHLLHTTKSIHSSARMSDSETHADITKNYHRLALLTRYRWRMEVNPILPFHLAALEAMQVALGRGDSVD